MATVLPETHEALLTFASSHALEWAADPASIGLSPAQAAAVTEALDKARSAVESASAARQAALSATMTQERMLADLHSACAGAIRAIKNFAAESSSPVEVYIAARIPEPLPRSRPMAPEAPYGLSAALDAAVGWITLSWKARQPKGMSGVVYRVERSTDDGPSAFIGFGRRDKTFIDQTIPPGARRVCYSVQSLRGDRASPPGNALVVNLTPPSPVPISSPADSPAAPRRLAA